MEIAQEEIFGPVLGVISADSLDQAIEIVNGSRYGNGTSIFTESGAAVRRYRADVEVGMIGVNIGVAAPVAFFPFSGWKDSFFGDLHAQAGDAVDFYTRKKTVTTRWFSGGATGQFFMSRGTPLMATTTKLTERQLQQLERRTSSTPGARRAASRRCRRAAPRALGSGTTTATRYLDFSSQLVNTNIGHQHPKVVAAIKEQADLLCTVAPQHANDKRARAGPAGGRARARRHRHGVLHQRRRRGERERDAHGAPPHRPPQDDGRRTARTTAAPAARSC